MINNGIFAFTFLSHPFLNMNTLSILNIRYYRKPLFSIIEKGGLGNPLDIVASEKVFK
jgi:hypothetical protein